MTLKHTPIAGLALLALLSTLNSQLSTAFAQGTAFTYQGRLNDGPGPATGLYDLRFSVWDAPTNGIKLAGLTNSAVPVSAGLFAVTLDFGSGIFTGPDRWLNISVRTNGSLEAYSILWPRQPLTPSPYSLYAPAAGTASTAATATVATLATAVAGGAVNNVALEANAVTGDKIADGTITDADISPSANIDAGKIVGGDLQAARLKVGSGHELSGSGATIAGGLNNTNTALYATIAGGEKNSTAGRYSAVGGGWGNLAGGPATWYSTVSGGTSNTANGAQAAIGGGAFNSAAGHQTAIAGGAFNLAAGRYDTIAGGAYNYATNQHATIAGGVSNTVWMDKSSIGGGANNYINGVGATVAGGQANQANGLNSVISGGSANGVTGDFGTVSGGSQNTASGQESAVSGGFGNTASGGDATVSGGYSSTASGWYTAVGGGRGNLASGGYAAVGGGHQNTASGNYATVGGGIGNLATNMYATVPGGWNNVAGGTSSLAAGRRGQALHDGSFVWADSQNLDFASTATNQFLIRAQGGVGINTTNSAGAALTVNGAVAANALRAPGAGIGTGTFAFVHRAVGTNTGANVTTIYNPLSDGDPGALVIVTHNWTADTNSGTKYNTTPVGVWYNGSHWTIFNEDLTSMALGHAFNVMIVKP